MSSSVAITAWGVWNVAGVSINAAPLQGAGVGLAPWPASPEAPLTHRRARPRPAVATALVQLAGGLLSFRRHRIGFPTLPDPVDVRLGTAAGSRMVDLDFLRTLKERGDAFGSPSTFAYTLSTAVIGEVSLVFGLRGGLSTLSSGGVSGLAAIITGAARVATGRSNACLCGGMEVCGSPSDVIALFLLEAAPASLRVPSLGRWGLSFGPEPAPTSLEVPSMLENLASAAARGENLDLRAASPDGHLAHLSIVSAAHRLSTECSGS